MHDGIPELTNCYEDIGHLELVFYSARLQYIYRISVSFDLPNRKWHVFTELSSILANQAITISCLESSPISDTQIISVSYPWSSPKSDCQNITAFTSVGRDIAGLRRHSQYRLVNHDVINISCIVKISRLEFRPYKCGVKKGKEFSSLHWSSVTETYGG